MGGQVIRYEHHSASPNNIGAFNLKTFIIKVYYLCYEDLEPAITKFEQKRKGSHEFRRDLRCTERGNN